MKCNDEYWENNGFIKKCGVVLYYYPYYLYYILFLLSLRSAITVLPAERPQRRGENRKEKRKETGILLTSRNSAQCERKLKRSCTVDYYYFALFPWVSLDACLFVQCLFFSGWLILPAKESPNLRNIDSWFLSNSITVFLCVLVDGLSFMCVMQCYMFTYICRFTSIEETFK